jgi:transposase-like protein
MCPRGSQSSLCPTPTKNACAHRTASSGQSSRNSSGAPQKVRVFPNLDSLERLSTAVLVEIDEKWETETKAYIKWEQHDD